MPARVDNLSALTEGTDTGTSVDGGGEDGRLVARIRSRASREYTFKEYSALYTITRENQRFFYD